MVEQKYVLDECLKSISRLAENNNIKVEDALRIIALSQKKIPISIFNNDLSVLESVVKFLVENKEMSYKETGLILNRDPIVIGITYRRSKKKHAPKLDDKASEGIPCRVFSNRKLSAFENIVWHLKNDGLRIHEIAVLLKRDDRTIWTVLERARRKNNESN